MLIQALLIFLVTFLLKMSNYHLPNIMIDRPIVVGFAIGLLLGDVKTGILIGAQLELVFLGVVAIGATSSADPCTATAIATSFSILHGLSIEEAVALGVAVGYVSLVFLSIEPAIAEFFNPIVDGFYKRDEYKKYNVAIWATSSLVFSITPLFTFLAVMFGGDLVTNILAALPEFVLTGINTAGAILPVVGLTMMCSLLWSKKVAIYFFLGFVLMKYLQVDTIFLLVIAVFIALTDFFRSTENKSGDAPTQKNEEEAFLQ